MKKNLFLNIKIYRTSSGWGWSWDFLVGAGVFCDSIDRFMKLTLHPSFYNPHEIIRKTEHIHKDLPGVYLREFANEIFLIIEGAAFILRDCFHQYNKGNLIRYSMARQMRRRETITVSDTMKLFNCVVKNA